MISKESKRFVVISAATFVVTFFVALVAFTVNFFPTQEPKFASALLGIAASTAVGLAGAWVVVMLAEQALVMQKRSTKNEDPEYQLALRSHRTVELLRAHLATALAAWRLAAQAKPVRGYSPVGQELVRLIDAVETACLDDAFCVVLSSVVPAGSGLQINFDARRAQVIQVGRLIRESVSPTDAGQPAVPAVEKPHAAKQLHLRTAFWHYAASELGDSIKDIQKFAKEAPSSVDESTRGDYFKALIRDQPLLNVSAEARALIELRTIGGEGHNTIHARTIQERLCSLVQAGLKLSEVQSKQKPIWIEDESQAAEGGGDGEQEKTWPKIPRVVHLSLIQGESRPLEALRELIGFEVFPSKFDAATINIAAKQSSKKNCLVVITDNPEQLIAPAELDHNVVVFYENSGSWLTREMVDDLRKKLEEEKANPKAMKRSLIVFSTYQPIEVIDGTQPFSSFFADGYQKIQNLAWDYGECTYQKITKDTH